MSEDRDATREACEPSWRGIKNLHDSVVIPIELAKQIVDIFLADAFEHRAWRKTQTLGELERRFDVERGHYRREYLGQQTLIEACSPAKIDLAQAFIAEVLADQLRKRGAPRFAVRVAVRVDVAF